MDAPCPSMEYSFPKQAIWLNKIAEHLPPFWGKNVSFFCMDNSVKGDKVYDTLILLVFLTVFLLVFFYKDRLAELFL